MLQVTATWCEHTASPLGLGEPRPRFGWKLASDRTDVRQVAYRLRVGDWDSGRVESDASAFVPYGGPDLTSREARTWTVEVWDNFGDHAASAENHFEMGLLEPGDWSAEYIGAPFGGGPRTPAPAPYLRKPFRAKEKPVRARLYATALGIYEASMNGKRIGNDAFAPGWTDNNFRVQVQVYDVTDHVQAGDNVLGAILGDGWYCGNVEWRGRQLYGDRPRFLGQLELTYADGSTERVVSDASWRWSFGPILENDLIMGEAYDARRELPGWDAVGYDDARWAPVETFADPGIARVMMQGPTVKPQEEIQPIAPPTEYHTWPLSRWTFDLGQNMVGRIRLRVRGKAGQTLILRYAEILDDKGKIYTENLRTAKQTDHYTLKGDGEEVWESKFTFHGFRYVEVAGLTERPDESLITGIVLHSDIPKIGHFECSEPLLNQLQHNIEWGQKGNFVDVPTDCPQRDERLGWTGDAQVFVRTAAFLRDVRGFFNRWQQDIADSQDKDGRVPPIVPNTAVVGGDGGPAWSDAAIICPWTIYQMTGDDLALRKHYRSIRAFVDSLALDAKDYIRSYPGFPGFSGFGDWLSINAETPHDLLGTAFFAYSARLLSEVAGTLGELADQAKYADLAEKVKAAFQRRYVTSEGVVASGTQTAYVLALHFDLLPEELRARAAEELVRDIRKRGNHLSTGFVGSPYLNHVLSSTGHLDVAYDLLHQKSWPSWLYAVTQGATTIWERWDGWTHDKGFQDPGMNSFNHYAYGAIGDWLVAVVAGLTPEDPGFKKVGIAPNPGGGLTHARASLNSTYGPISAAWELAEGRFRLSVELPPNVSGTVTLPGGTQHAIGSGSHHFEE